QGAKACTLFGDGLQAYEQDIGEAVEAVGGQVREVRPEQQRPSAVSVGLAGRQRLEAGQVAGSELVPRYVQRTEAEVKFDEQQGSSALERRRQRVANKLAQGRGKRGRTDADPQARK
ncbi:MAG TPA: hypothetical protein PLT27_01640, partial [Nitrospira sp.]|nr:hypothetical protein [Nitrospira sp.]